MKNWTKIEFDFFLLSSQATSRNGRYCVEIEGAFKKHVEAKCSKEEVRNQVGYEDRSPSTNIYKECNLMCAHLRVGEMKVELGEAAVEKNKMRMKLFYLIRWQAWCKNVSHDL